MKDKYYYVLKDCLTHRENWANDQKNYLKFRGLIAEAKKRRFKENKLIFTIYSLIYLPIIILNFIQKIREHSQYHKALCEIEVLKEELNKYEVPQIKYRRKNAEN